VNGRVEAAALEAGYQRGFALGMKAMANSGFTLARSAVYAWDGPYSVMKKAGGGPAATLEHVKERVINAYSGGTILLNRLRGRHLPRPD